MVKVGCLPGLVLTASLGPRVSRLWIGLLGLAGGKGRHARTSPKLTRSGPKAILLSHPHTQTHPDSTQNPNSSLDIRPLPSLRTPDQLQTRPYFRQPKTHPKPTRATLDFNWRPLVPTNQAKDLKKQIILKERRNCDSVWVSWGKQATKERFPKSKPIPGPKDQGFPHTREQQPKENKPNKKRVNPQPWSTTGRTTGPYQPGGSPRSLSPPRCRRSTQGFGDAHLRRDGTQNLSQTPQVSHYRDIPGDEINHG